MSQLKSNQLSVSAEAIRNLVAASESLATQSVEKALEAGHLLLAAKSECKHGEWLPFLKRAEVPERKAQRYMTLVRSGLKSVTVTDLGGIKAALEFLACRSRADAAYRVIEMSLPKDGETVDETLAKFALRINGVELLHEAMTAMMDCFPARGGDEAQRTDSEQDAESFAKQLMDPINDFILAERDRHQRGTLAMAALRQCELAPSGGSAEILLRVLMSLNRLDDVSAAEVMSHASHQALEQIVARAA